jgi:hypothetical protein
MEEVVVEKVAKWHAAGQSTFGKADCGFRDASDEKQEIRLAFPAVLDLSHRLVVGLVASSSGTDLVVATEEEGPRRVVRIAGPQKRTRPNRHPLEGGFSAVAAGS